MPPLPRLTPPPAPPVPNEFRLKPTRQPMLWAALAYSVGVVAGAHLLPLAALCIAAAASFLGASIYFVTRRKWLGLALALGSFFLAGALQIQLRVSSSVRDPSLDPFAYGPQVQITAHVTREGRLREATRDEVSQTLDVQTEEIVTDDGSRLPIRAGVRLGVYAPSSGEAVSPTASRLPAMHLFRYGERIRLPVGLKLPHNFRNPGAFDYEGYLAANGIDALGSAKAEDIQVLPGFAGSRLELWRSRIHSSIIAKVHTLWPPAQAA